MRVAEPQSQAAPWSSTLVFFLPAELFVGRCKKMQFCFLNKGTGGPNERNLPQKAGQAAAACSSDRGLGLLWL
jgi:hypothetical protein